MSQDLLPCPFCGTAAVLDFHKGNRWAKGYQAYCESKDCKLTPYSLVYPTADEAIEAWNTRKSPAGNV